MGQIYSSNPQSLVRVQETLKCGLGWYSVQHVLGNQEYGSEDSGGLSETHASGNREHARKIVQNMKDRLRHDESRKQLGNIDELREDAYFDMD